MRRWNSGAALMARSGQRPRCGFKSNSKPIGGVGSHEAMPEKPVILAIDDDPLALDRVVDELARRYARDYEIAGESSADAALTRIEALAETAQPLALVLADQWLREPHLTGESLLGRTRQLHPGTKRALLLEWGAWGHEQTEEAILRAMATGLIDYYVIKPWRSPDEQFHR